MGNANNMLKTYYRIYLKDITKENKKSLGHARLNRLNKYKMKERRE